MKINRKYYPKRKATLSLQFYYDKDGTLHLMVTRQHGDISKKHIDLYYFGNKFAEHDDLTHQEKDSFYTFCVGYIARRLGLEGKEKITLLANDYGLEGRCND